MNPRVVPLPLLRLQIIPVVLRRRRHMTVPVREVIRAFVVLGVGELPSEVRDEERLVHDEAADVVEGLRTHV